MNKCITEQQINEHHKKDAQLFQENSEKESEKLSLTCQAKQHFSLTRLVKLIV